MTCRVAVDNNTLRIITTYPLDMDISDLVPPANDISLSTHFLLPDNVPIYGVAARRNTEGDIELYQDMELTSKVFEINYKILRSERNIKITACDWTQGNDSPLSPEKKDEWATYRQSLRDLPNTVTDPTNVTWPTPPS
jgi:hypothetical protein